MPDNIKQQLFDTAKKVSVFLGKAARFTLERLLVIYKKVLPFLERAVRIILDLLVRLGRQILPVLKAMAPSVLLGAVTFILLFLTGLGDTIGRELALLTGIVPALLIIFAICFIPAVSPVLGPGIIIAVAAAIFTGEQIAGGMAKPVVALAALLALDAQLGGSFIPPNHVLGENEPETISAGVPGIVFTRLLTVPAAVLLSCLLSFL
ncbi:MAG: hypothetical protein FWG07_07205 [Treponema sp.]|nr:hypothetical protein [Treponema sp.]